MMMSLYYWRCQIIIIIIIIAANEQTWVHTSALARSCSSHVPNLVTALRVECVVSMYVLCTYLHTYILCGTVRIRKYEYVESLRRIFLLKSMLCYALF